MPGTPSSACNLAIFASLTSDSAFKRAILASVERFSFGAPLLQIVPDQKGQFNIPSSFISFLSAVFFRLSSDRS